MERVGAKVDRRPDLAGAAPVRRTTVEDRTPIGHPPILPDAGRVMSGTEAARILPGTP